MFLSQPQECIGHLLCVILCGSLVSELQPQLSVQGLRFRLAVKKWIFFITELDDTSGGCGRAFLTCLVGCLPTMCTVSQPTNICCDVNSIYLLSWQNCQWAKLSHCLQTPRSESWEPMRRHCWSNRSNSGYISELWCSGCWVSFSSGVKNKSVSLWRVFTELPYSYVATRHGGNAHLWQTALTYPHMWCNCRSFCVTIWLTHAGRAPTQFMYFFHVQERPCA